MFGNLSIQFYFSAQTYLMKKYIAILMLLYSQVSLAQKPFYIFLEQFDQTLTEAELPKLSLSKQELFEKIDSHLIYPEFAKKQRLEEIVHVIVSLDEKGTVLKYETKRPGFPMFDTTAINIIKKIENNWIPPTGIKGVKIPSTATIPVQFVMAINHENHKTYFGISVFPSRHVVVTDSVLYTPACIRYRNTHERKNPETNKIDTVNYDHYVYKQISKQVPSMASFAGVYGTVRFGLNVDKDGNVFNVHYIHKVCKSINDKALEELNELEYNWVPAYENGIPIDSDIEFDFKYNIDKNTSYTNLGGAYALKTDYNYKSEYGDLEAAYKLLNKEKYEQALIKFNAIEGLLLDNIEIKYQIANIQTNLGNLVEACTKLNEIKNIALKTSYPSNVTESMVDEAINKSCLTK